MAQQTLHLDTTPQHMAQWSQGATQQSVHCESLTPTQGATHQSVDCESLTPTQGATEQSVGVKKKERKWEAKLHSRGSPTKGSKIRSGPQQWGKKSEVAASPLPSRGAQRRVEMLRHPCLLGDPQQRGSKSEVVPKKGEHNPKWLPHPCLLGGPKEGGNAMSPLPSWGSPTKGSKIRSGPQHRATKSEVATSPLPSWGPKRGRKCYVTPAFSGIPNKGEQNQKWSLTKGNKIRSGYLTLAFSGVQKRAGMLRHPCILGDPQQRGAKSEVVPNKGEHNPKWLPHPCLLGGPKRGRKSYVTPAFSGIPNKGEQNQKWSPKNGNTI